MQFSENFKNITLPKLFRVGMTPSKPWMYFELDPRTNKKLKGIHYLISPMFETAHLNGFATLSLV